MLKEVLEGVERLSCSRVVLAITVVLSVVGALVTVTSHSHSGIERTVLEGMKVLMKIGDSMTV